MKHRFVDDIREPVHGRPCATGCRRDGRHIDTRDPRTDACTLPCAPDCPRRCRAHCRGCEPRPALTDAAVCGRCAGQTRRAIAATPALVAWIRAQDEPAASTGTEPKLGGSKNAPLPFRADAIDTADELHAVLAAWCRTIVDEHPAGFTGPDLTGSVRARRVLADNTGPVIGLGIGRTWGTGDTVAPAQPTERAARWLLTHLEWALTRDWAPDLVRELTAIVTAAEHRWPTAEPPTRLPTVCPSCGRASLVRHAPAWPEAPITIVCEATECGEVIPEALYDFHARRVLTDHQEDQ